MSTPHGRNRATRVDKDRSRRWGPLTAETAIVLGVAGAIVAGAFLVEAIQPARERTNTISGKDTIEIHQVGTGGVKPGALQRRTIVQQPVKPVVPTTAPTATAKPGKTPKPQVTAAPTQDVPGSGPNVPGQGGGGNDGGPLCGILGNCPDTEPDPGETPEPQPSEPPDDTEPTPAPTTDTDSNTASKTDTASAKKKKTPTPSPEPASPR